MPKFRGTLMSSTYLGLAFLSLCTTSRLNAETFTITLAPAEQIGVHGDYLSAPFDFGTAFSEIQSATLEFMMPGGYQGTAMTTGNSSVFRSLNLLLYDAAIPVPAYWYNSASSLGASAFDVRAGTLADFRFVYSGSLGDDDSPPDWPDFLFTGMGQVGWTSETHASHHPLPGGVPISESTTWLLPGEIESAQLTIVGTPVPEPASAVLLSASTLAVICFRWLRHRRPTVARIRNCR